MIDAWAPPLPQALLVVSQDISKGVYGDIGPAAVAAAAAADLATMQRMYACILGGDVEACVSAPEFMSGFSVYVDPAGQPEEIERVQDELSRRGAHLAAKTDVYDENMHLFNLSTNVTLKCPQEPRLQLRGCDQPEQLGT
jgi:hypothetical protein